MKNYIANNKILLVSMMSWGLFILIFIYYNTMVEDKYIGTIHYQDGAKSYSSLESYNNSQFVFKSYLENESGDVYSYSCEGIYEIKGNKLFLKTNKMQGGCLDSYEIKKVNGFCYLFSHKQITSRNQAFYVCKQSK